MHPGPEKKKLDSKILFVDAVNEFVRVGIRNKLNDGHIGKILKCYASRESQKYFSRLAEYKEIRKNNYSIAVSLYVKEKYDLGQLSLP